MGERLRHQLFCILNLYTILERPHGESEFIRLTTMHNYLGIDVSKHTLSCCLIKNDEFIESAFTNDTKGFKELQSWLHQNHATELHCCCEATGIYHQAIAEYLSQHYKITVENPRKIKGFSVTVLQRSKTDKQDARLIARYCQSMKPPEWQPPSSESKQLQELTRFIERTKKQRASEQTKYQTAPECIKHHIQATIKHLNSLIKNAESELKVFYNQHQTYSQQHKRLKTIPGIGNNAASVLLSVLLDGRFEKASQFVAYIGLDPRQRQSGTSVNGRPSISKVGKSSTRSSLFLPAMVAYRDGAFPEFVARLKKSGKKPKVIIVAIMRKLAVIAFHLINTGQDYDKARYQ